MATYYSSHNAAGAGAGTIGDPYTLQELFDNTASADLGLVMATGTYTPSVQLDLDTNAGSVATRVEIRGANSDGTDDGTVATVSGSSLGASTDLLAITMDWLDIANLRFTAATADNVSLTTDNTRFTDCRFDNATSDGLLQNSFDHYVQLLRCEIDNNGGFGYGGSLSSRGNVFIDLCSIHDNGSYGCRLAQDGTIARSLIYKNTGHGVILALDSTSQGIAIRDSTIATNTGAGISVVAGTTIVNALIARTILYENGEYGIDLNAANIEQFRFLNLAVHNNTSGDIDAGSLPSETVTDDPTFAVETAGSEDYTPSAAALKLGYTPPSGIGGTDYQYIGAIQPTAAAGSPSGARNPLGGPIG